MSGLPAHFLLHGPGNVFAHGRHRLGETPHADKPAVVSRQDLRPVKVARTPTRARTKRKYNILGYLFFTSELINSIEMSIAIELLLLISAFPKLMLLLLLENFPIDQLWTKAFVGLAGRMLL